MDGPPLAESLILGAALQLGPLLVLGLLYGRRAHTLGGAGHPVPRARQASFYTGLGVIALALSSLGGASQDLLWAHMTEHLLLGDIASLLLVLGLTGPMLAPVMRIRFFDRLRILTHPLIALPLWAVGLYVWHLPVLYEAALRHPGVHALQHACFLGLGANMWMCLFGPLPKPDWFGNLAKLFYIVAVRLAGTVLGNVFLWSGTLFYPWYRTGDARFHISPIADQNIAGAIMMVEESFLTLGLFCWLFLKTARESEERQELTEFAAAHGLELTPERARRAVSAGRGQELMRRLRTRAGLPDDNTPPHAAAAAEEPAAAGDATGATGGSRPAGAPR